jgi:uncharacterized alkaline shock family protein YloU
MSDFTSEIPDDYHPAPGKTTIAAEVLTTIARLTTLDVPGVSRMAAVPSAVDRLFSRTMGEGVRISLDNDTVSTDLYVVLQPERPLRQVGKQIQIRVERALSEMVGMQVGRINVHIEDIDYPSERGT